MKSSTQEQMEGMYHEVKGWCRELAGRFTHNSQLEAAGMIEYVAGRVQEKIGQFKKVRRA